MTALNNAKENVLLSAAYGNSTRLVRVRFRKALTNFFIRIPRLSSSFTVTEFVFKFLVKKRSFDVNSTRADGSSALMLAAGFGPISVIKAGSIDQNL